MQKVACMFFQRLLKDRMSPAYRSSKFSEGQEKKAQISLEQGRLRQSHESDKLLWRLAAG